MGGYFVVILAIGYPFSKIKVTHELKQIPSSGPRRFIPWFNGLNHEADKLCYNQVVCTSMSWYDIWLSIEEKQQDKQLSDSSAFIRFPSAANINNTYTWCLINYPAI